MSSTAAIAGAIAARFTGVTANGESIAIGPTHRLPNAITTGPALLVYPPTGRLGISMRLRDDTLTFAVRLLRDPLDVPSRSDALYAWYDAMRDRIEARSTLGLDYVAWAEVTDARLELDGEEYGLGVFDVVELQVQVRLNEVVSTLGV